MKKGIIAILTTTILLNIVGCNKDFLEKTPSEKISSEQIKEAVKKDPSILEGYVRGMYSNMYMIFTGGVKDEDAHDDFGQKGYDIYSDLLSADMALSREAYNWYVQLARLKSPVDFTREEVAHAWRYYYKIIGQANGVIDLLGGVDADLTTDVQKSLMGQAQAMRAHSYFYLANLYSKEGYGTGNEKILPLYTSSETTQNPPLSTSKEVYDLIIKDLRQAVLYLSDDRSNKSEVNKPIAQGILAYALAARGTRADLEEVVDLTNSIIDDGGFPLTTKNEVVANIVGGKVTNPQSGFNDVNTKSWMWGMDITLANKLDLVSWWGQIDIFTYSYAAAGAPKAIDKGLYDQILPTDLRKGQFSSNSASTFYLTPINKFFAPDRIQMGQRDITTDYLYMRVDEFYLLNAEANAKIDKDVDARNRLKELLAERFDDPADYAYIDGLSGQNLRDEIYLQTRIELWGEGKSYLALKRNKAKSVRGSNHRSLVGEEINYNDPRITFVIPQSEVINNPNLYK